MAAAIPMVLQALSTVGTYAAANPVTTGALVGGGSSAAQGGDIGDVLKGAALGGLGSFAGGALGRALGGALGSGAGGAAGAAGTSATTPLAGATGGGLSAAGANATLPTLLDPGLVVTAGAPSAAGTVGAMTGGALSSAGQTPAAEGAPRAEGKDPVRDLADNAGKQIANAGVSALTGSGASTPVAGGGSTSSVVRPAAGGSGAAAAGLAYSGSQRPNIYPWADAA